MKGRLREHFVKLSQYSQCQVFIQVAYVTTENTKSIRAALIKIARAYGNSQLRFRRHDLLPRDGSRPNGFIARYDRSDREVAVIFLLVDVDQSDMKNAAKQAKKVKSATVSGSITRRSARTNRKV